MKKLFLICLVFLCLSGVTAQSKKAPSLRDLFMQLPEKYFSIDCCEGRTYREAKAKYLKLYLDVEDAKNGFLSGGGDGAQEAFELALFRRPNGTYLVAFYTVGEGGVEDYPWCVFLDYRAGKWRDLSKTVIPGYDPQKLIYQLPRRGTTIEVFQKDENGADLYKGKKLYDLVWSGGRFSVKK